MRRRSWQRSETMMRWQGMGIRALVMSAVLALVASAGPAAATTIVDTDTFTLGSYQKGHACYGACATSSPTLLTWRLLDIPANHREGRAYGGLGIKGPNEVQICARIRTVYLRRDGTRLGVRVGTGVNVRCLAAGGGAAGAWRDADRRLQPPS